MAKKPAKKVGDPLIGAIVERRWQILDQLGSGGMGVVYRAERVGLGKQVALKFLHQSVAESKAAVGRFEREAKAISRLHHMHCISILDFGVYRKQPYIVMEFVQGRQLTELDMAALTPSRAVAMVRQILLGLQHAHARGVIHRDLKLSNVMLVEMTGTEDLIKILDFGLARVSGVGEEHSLTDGMIAGTPSYMSPEQALGKKTDSAHRHLFGGRDALRTGDRQAALRRRRRDRAPPHAGARAAAAAAQARAAQAHQRGARARPLARAAEKPADRFQNVTEFVAALDDTPEGQETLTPTVARERKPLRARWRLMLVAAAACVALGAAGALWARAYFTPAAALAGGGHVRGILGDRGTPAAPPPVRAAESGELRIPPKPWRAPEPAGADADAAAVGRGWSKPAAVPPRAVGRGGEAGRAAARGRARARAGNIRAAQARAAQARAAAVARRPRVPR